MKGVLRTIILLLVRILGLPGVRRAHQKRVQTPSATPRVLLIRPDHLGDLVLTTPVLNALHSRLPEASITMMVGPWSSEVVARHTALNRLITCAFPGFQRTAQKPLSPYILLFSIAQQLRRGEYDLAINLRPDFWWGAALLYLAGIPRRVGYAIQPGQPFLNYSLPFQTPEPATISSLKLLSTALEALGYAPLEEPYTPERYPLQFQPTMYEQRWVDTRLQSEGIEPDIPIVVIHPGSGAAVKLWRTEAWVSCANALTALLTFPTPVRIILTGSKNERPMLEEIARGIQAPTTIISDATIGQLAALLGRAKMVLGVDSGPLHVAVAQETPTIAIFGPADARIFGPWGVKERHLVIAASQKCPDCHIIPCGRLDIGPEELAAHPCVRLVPEQQMLNTIKMLY